MKDIKIIQYNVQKSKLGALIPLLHSNTQYDIIDHTREHKNTNHTLAHYKPCYRNIKHTPKACQACKAAIAPLLRRGALAIAE